MTRCKDLRIVELRDPVEVLSEHLACLDAVIINVIEDEYAITLHLKFKKKPKEFLKKLDEMVKTYRGEIEYEQEGKIIGISIGTVVGEDFGKRLAEEDPEWKFLGDE